MKRILFAVIVALASLTVSGQDLPKFKVAVVASASEIKGLFPDSFGSEGTTYRPNIAGEAMATIGSAKNVRFSAGGTYKYNFDTYVSTYYLNGQISYHASIFEPFVRFSAGIDKYSDGPGVFSREILLSADLNLGKFTVRPLGIGFKRTGQFLAPAERTLQTGIGFNFN